MRHGSTLSLMIVAAISSLTWAGDVPDAQLPDSRLGRPVQPLLLLSRTDVRTELNMSAEQASSAERAIRSFYVQAATLRGKPNTQDTVNARRAVDEAAVGWIETQLATEQRTRLTQIQLQWEGPAALAKRPVVAETLSLSPEQKATLARAIKTRDEARDRGDADAEYNLGQEVLRSLSKTQGESWRQMMGKPFTFRSVRTAQAQAEPLPPQPPRAR